MVSSLKGYLMDQIRFIDRFFFAPVDLYSVSLFRCLLSLLLFFMYFIRFLDVSTFHFNDGMIHASDALLIIPEITRPSFPLFFQSDMGIYLTHVAYLVGLLLLSLGVIGRKLTWVIFLLHLSLMQRNFGLVYGADLFANFWLFYLSFIDHNKYFNVLLWWKDRNSVISKIHLPRLESDMVSTVGIRLLQIQLCLAYAYTGIEKLKGQQWWEGTAVWYVVGIEEIMALDLSFLQHFPVLVAIMTMVTVIFEVYFPFAVASKRLKPIWLSLGVSLHLMIAIFMDLFFFCFVMILVYLIFLDMRGFRMRLQPYLDRWKSQ